MSFSSAKTTPTVVLSLGAGVQSTALLLMSARGELPRIDHAIFADTRYEPPAVYRHFDWLKGEADRAGIPIHIVSRGDLRADAIDFRRQRYNEEASTGRKGHASIPLFVLNPDGSQGMIRRQCTAEYKIEPIEKFIRREILGLKHGQRGPREPVIDQWFGITWDENQRMRTSPASWKRHVYPFCGPFGHDLLPRLWRRDDCLNWLHTNYPGREFPRSACICCPYRTNAEWRHMRERDPESFADAVEFDKQIRTADRDGQVARGMLVGLPFVHRQLIPLGEVDLRSDEERGQFSLFADPATVERLDAVGQVPIPSDVNLGDECEGMCGL